MISDAFDLWQIDGFGIMIIWPLVWAFENGPNRNEKDFFDIAQPFLFGFSMLVSCTTLLQNPTQK